jgi:uncharacterized membrane protein
MRSLLEAGDQPVTTPHLWKIIASLVLSLAGVGVSIYLTIAHYVGTQILACSDAGLVNCAKVTTSAQSHFLGMPVAVVGLAFYLVVTAINLPWAWWSPDRRVHLARLALMAVGMAFVLYLVSAELLIIGNICIWCTTVHVITFLLFALVMATVPTMLGWTRSPLPTAAPDSARRGPGAGPRSQRSYRSDDRPGKENLARNGAAGRNGTTRRPSRTAKTSTTRTNGQRAGASRSGGRGQTDRPAGAGPKGRPAG